MGNEKSNSCAMTDFMVMGAGTGYGDWVKSRSGGSFRGRAASNAKISALVVNGELAAYCD